jgi:hypothetical protein
MDHIPLHESHKFHPSPRLLSHQTFDALLDSGFRATVALDRYAGMSAGWQKMANGRGSAPSVIFSAHESPVMSPCSAVDTAGHSCILTMFGA